MSVLESGSYARKFDNWAAALADLMDLLYASVTKSQPYYAQSLLDDGNPKHTLETIEAFVDAMNLNGTRTDISFDLNGLGSVAN